jgi:hypothetical protein
MNTLLRKPKDVAVRGENERRVAADATLLIVALHNTEKKNSLWYHVSHLRYQPLRPVFLRLWLETTRGPTTEQAMSDAVVFRMAEYKEENGVEHWWWVVGHDAFLSVSLEDTWDLQCYRLVDTDRVDGTQRLHARKFHGSTRTVWHGLNDMKKDIDSARVKDEEDDEAEKQHGDCVEVKEM